MFQPHNNNHSDGTNSSSTTSPEKSSEILNEETHSNGISAGTQRYPGSAEANADSRPKVPIEPVVEILFPRRRHDSGSRDNRANVSAELLELATNRMSSLAEDRLIRPSHLSLISEREEPEIVSFPLTESDDLGGTISSGPRTISPAFWNRSHVEQWFLKYFRFTESGQSYNLLTERPSRLLPRPTKASWILIVAVCVIIIVTVGSIVGYHLMKHGFQKTYTPTHLNIVRGNFSAAEIILDEPNYVGEWIESETSMTNDSLWDDGNWTNTDGDNYPKLNLTNLYETEEALWAEQRHRGKDDKSIMVSADEIIPGFRPDVTELKDISQFDPADNLLVDPLNLRN